MTLLNQIFDIYIDLNITLAITAVVWLAVKLLIARSGRKLTFTLQLGLLNGLFAVILLSPAIAAVYRHMVVEHVVPAAYSLNLADYAISQYLRGGIALPAQDFESLLAMRSQFTESILTLQPGLGAGIAVFLLTGCVWYAARLCRSFLQLRRFLASCHSWRRTERVDVLLSDRAAVPFSARGLWRHYVVVPSDMLANPEDLKLVLKHEFQHVRQGDVTWEVALELLRPLFFWNPFFSIWKSEVERLRELACDQKVTADGKVDLKSYCLCLMRAAQAGFAKRVKAADGAGTDIASVALLDIQDRLLRRSPGRKLRRRVEALLETGRVCPHWGLVGLVVVPMVAAILLTALSIQKPADWSHDRLMLSSIVNLERLETINSFGERPLR